MRKYVKRCVKSYLAFTSLIYKLAIFVVMPIVMVLISLGLDGYNNWVVMLCLPVYEIISDNWLFGGIQSKDAEKLDYMKTSGAGMQVIRTALRMDLLRKFLSAAGITVITYITLWLMRFTHLMACRFFCENWGELLYAALVSWLCSALGTVLSRYGSTVWINTMIAYLMVVFILLIFIIALPRAVGYDMVLPCNIIIVIFGALISIIAVKTAMKKVEGSYYDK